MVKAWANRSRSVLGKQVREEVGCREVGEGPCGAGIVRGGSPPEPNRFEGGRVETESTGLGVEAVADGGFPSSMLANQIRVVILR